MTLLYADFGVPRGKAGGRSTRPVAGERTRPRRAPSLRVAAADRCGAAPRRVLVPILDAAGAMAAARHVARDAMHGERLEVHLLYVGTATSLRVQRTLLGRDGAAVAERSLRPARDLLRAFHVRCAAHAQCGGAARAIVAAARDLEVDSIVIGAAREGSPLRLLEDRVIEDVVDFAPAPVEVVVDATLSRAEEIGIPLGLALALGLLAVRAVD